MENALNRNRVALKIKQNAVGCKRKAVTIFDSAQPFDAPGQPAGEAIDFAVDGFGEVNREFSQIIVRRLSYYDAVFHSSPVALPSCTFQKVVVRRIVLSRRRFPLKNGPLARVSSLLIVTPLDDSAQRDFQILRETKRIRPSVIGIHTLNGDSDFRQRTIATA